MPPLGRDDELGSSWDAPSEVPRRRTQALTPPPPLPSWFGPRASTDDPVAAIGRAAADRRLRMTVGRGIHMTSAVTFNLNIRSTGRARTNATRRRLRVVHLDPHAATARPRGPVRLRRCHARATDSSAQAYGLRRHRPGICRNSVPGSYARLLAIVVLGLELEELTSASARRADARSQSRPDPRGCSRNVGRFKRAGSPCAIASESGTRSTRLIRSTPPSPPPGTTGSASRVARRPLGSRVPRRRGSVRSAPSSSRSGLEAASGAFGAPVSRRRPVARSDPRRLQTGNAVQLS